MKGGRGGGGGGVEKVKGCWRGRRAAGVEKIRGGVDKRGWRT